MQTKLKFIIAASAALVCATAAHGQSAGSFILNAGWANVATQKSVWHDEDSNVVNIKSQHANALGLSGTYFITDNVAGELSLSTPVHLELKSREFGKVGSVQQFSPALLLKYYFLNAENKFRPYVGVGVSRVLFKKARGEQFEGKIFHYETSFNFKNKWAPVANAGFTYQFTDQLFGGVSVSYMPVKSGVGTLTNTDVGVSETSTDTLKLNPVTTFISLGYKF